MLDLLFYIFIYPIQLVLEIIFSILYTSVFKENIGIALAGLSLTVSICCLPMYSKAEEIQKFERNIQKKLTPKISSIKKNFSGDEQYFILSAYYRENKYHPIYTLRSSLSLLLQIPFFIAAYSFLKNLDIISGKSFFIFNDLLKPDGLLNIFGISINILPILMTIINLASGIIYSNDLLKTEKIQLYITPFIFLILLYNSPSALVIYWTLNNIFSFFKILYLKFNIPKIMIYYLVCFCSVIFTIYIFFIRYNAPERTFRNKAITIIILVLIIIMPFFLRFIRYIINKYNLGRLNDKYINRVFIISIISIWLLIGFFIPANIISSDPSQFTLINNIVKPIHFMYYPLIQGFGLFCLWPFIIFSMFSNKIKIFLSLLAASLTLSFFANYFIFQANYGIISQTLSFSLISGQYLSKGIGYQILNILLFFFLFGFIYLIFKIKKNHMLYSFFIFLSLGIFSYSLVKTYNILEYYSLNKISQPSSENNFSNSINTDLEEYSINLSKNGKNIFIIMLDGAVNSYFSIFLEKRPDMLDNFNGFTYYPNTASLYRRTMFGAPPIFGGYEYTSYNIENFRKNISIPEKQREAVTILPLLFKEANFTSIVSDVIDNGFFESTSINHFESFNIKSQSLDGNFTSKYLNDVLGTNKIKSNTKIDEFLKRNLLMYSILVSSPYSIRDFIYINGRYWGTKDYYLDSAISDTTINSYATLYYLPDFSSISEDGNYFHMISSNITHDHVFFQYPNFTLEAEITEHGDNFFNNTKSFKTFHVNSAAFMLLSRWFNHLRKEGVWDNTRIIIVSDHGDSGLFNPDFSVFQNNYVLPLNSLLLVKDFDQNEPLHINHNFMTSADVPLLSLKGILENPINPFTNNNLTSEKSEGIYIYTQGYTNSKWYQGTSFLNNNSTFLHVKDNIFERNNWSEVKYRDFRK